MIDILIVAWNRPKYLRQTLDSVFRQTHPSDRVFVVDNGSGAEVQNIIRADARLCGYTLWTENRGINAAVEEMTQHLSQDYLLVSDADMVYRCPFSVGVDYLNRHGTYEAFSYHDSPEHPVVWVDGAFRIKATERGCSLLLHRALFERLRPFPVDKLIDWDWWVCRDSPHRTERIVAIDSAVHLGAQNSTWNVLRAPEYWAPE